MSALKRKRSSSPYALALVLVLTAAASRWLLQPWLGTELPFIVFIIPVLVAAWYGRFRTGFFATAISGFVGWYFFVPPPWQLWKGGFDTGIRLSLFLFAGVLISFFCSRIRKSQADARRSETRFRSTFENAAVGIAHLSLTGRWIRVNQKLCEIVGYTPVELTRMSIDEITSVQETGRNHQLFATLLAGTETTYSSEHRFRRKDSDDIWVNLTVTLQRDEENSPEYFIVVIEDITLRRRAEDALRINLQQLQATFDGMVEPAILTAANGEILAVNSSWLALFELVAPPKVRFDWFDRFEFTTMDGARLENHQSPFFRALKGEVVREFEVSARNKSTGRTLCLLFGTSPVRDVDGRIVAVVGTAHDMTERKRGEQELQRSNAVLRQFAYAAAHDLQEPIRNVALASELMARRYAGQLDEDARHLLATSIDGARRMHRMVGDLLEYTKAIDAGETTMSVCGADQALNAAVSNLRNAINDCGAKVDCSPLPQVSVHETHLVQLFQNLIGNSLKYRRPEAPPCVRISATPQGSNYRFTIADNGIGFDPAYATRIFGLFRRLHRHADYPGTGIGLAICERIVEHYGGKIWAESANGQGATFHFVLPGRFTTHQTPD